MFDHMTRWLSKYAAFGVVLAGLMLTASGCGSSDTGEGDAPPPQFKSVDKQIEMLKSGDALVRRIAAGNLGLLGKDAEPAIPTLEEMSTKDADPQVREAATEALEKIRSSE